MPRLRRSNCNGPGFSRRRCGRGFTYHDPDGNRVTDPEIVERVEALVIPPAWTDVWICPWPSGHLQAVGTDARGRRQYLYHPAWRARRDAAKFDHMLEFARALPELRRVCARHLSAPDLSRDRVLACSVRLLDLGFFRIGTEGYAEQNQSYGLATLRKDHVRLLPDHHGIEFDYVSKSAKRRIETVVDPDVFAVVAALKRRRGGGEELLAYRDGRAWRDVRSEDINAWIQEATGGEFTAKDFRTWTATVLASVALAVSVEAARSATARKRAVARAMKEVSEYLGNTPAVCRSSYVDPRVVDRFQAGVTVRESLIHLAGGDGHGLSIHGEIEEAVLALLRDEADIADAA